MKQLLILSRDANHYRQLIEKSHEHQVDVLWWGSEQCPEELLSRAQILLAEPDLAAPLLTRCNNLEWLQSTWAGVTPLLKACKKDFTITGIKDVFGKQMREYIFAYVLHFSRDIPHFQQLQTQRLWQPHNISNLFGKTLGIMGVGSIGKEVAKLAKSFDMEVKGYTRSNQDCEFKEHYYAPNEIKGFCKALDYLVCLLPDTVDSKQLINQQTIDYLPSHCVLINAGRGQVIDDHALCDGLQKKQLKAAVLDVFDQEPLPKNHPFWNTPNLYITQHTAAVSLPHDIYQIFADNLHRYLSQQPMKYIIDREAGY